SRLRTMERAAYFSAWRDKKLHGIILVVTAPMGNAATRLEPYAIKNGIYAYGSLPQVDDLYVQQAREVDVKRREARVHQIQKAITPPSWPPASTASSARTGCRRVSSPASCTPPRCSPTRSSSAAAP